MFEIFIEGIIFYSKIIFYYIPRILVSALVLEGVTKILEDYFDFDEFFKVYKFMLLVWYIGGIAFVYYLLFNIKIISLNF